MKKIILILCVAGFSLPAIAQTLTNVVVSTVAPPAPAVIHKLTISPGQLDPQHPAGKRGFVSGTIAADGSATLTITYR